MKKIIFTRFKPDLWQYKVASELRKKGIRTISISLLEFDKEFFSEAFDEIICLDLPSIHPLRPKTLLKKITKNPIDFLRFFFKIFTINADVSICEGAPHYLAAFFIRLFKGRFPRIYFPYDFYFARFKNPKKHLPKREIWGEEYSFKNCDAIVCKSSYRELDLLPKSFNISSKPKLCFPCYALNEWFVPNKSEKRLSYHDKEIHSVFAGTYTVTPGYEVSSKDLFKEIVKQKIHCHIYPSPGTEIPLNDLKEIAPTKKLQKFVHIHKSVHPIKLSSELSKYDFGIHVNKTAPVAKPDSIKYFASNKFASFLEAMLPILINKELEVHAGPVKKNNIGIVVTKISDIKEMIERANYNEMIENIYKFREEYSVKNHINKLIRFINSLKRNISQK